MFAAQADFLSASAFGHNMQLQYDRHILVTAPTQGSGCADAQSFMYCSSRVKAGRALQLPLG